MGCSGAASWGTFPHPPGGDASTLTTHITSNQGTEPVYPVKPLLKTWAAPEMLQGCGSTAQGGGDVTSVTSAASELGQAAKPYRTLLWGMAFGCGDASVPKDQAGDAAWEWGPAAPMLPTAALEIGLG